MSDEDKVVSLGAARERYKNDEESLTEELQEKEDTTVYCSFCKRPNHQVIKMIQGPGVNICSECILVCLQYMMLPPDTVISKEAKRVLDAFWGEAKK